MTGKPIGVGVIGCGAISGAYLGADAVPAHLLAMLEDGPKGRGYIEQLAGRLAALTEA